MHKTSLDRENPYARRRLSALGLIISLALAPVLAPAGLAAELRWELSSNPSAGDDSIRAIAADADHLFLAGFDSVPGNQQFRIEKRDKRTGELVAEFGSLGVVNSDPSARDDAAMAVAVDAISIYVGGFQSTAGFPQWRVERRDKSSGSLISTFYGEGFAAGYSAGRSWPPDGGGVEAIAIYADDLYLAGQEFIGGVYVWRIERRDKNSAALITEFNGSGVLNISSGGYYKFLRGLQVDDNALYLGGSTDFCPGYSHDWQIQKRDRRTGAARPSFGNGGVVSVSACSGQYGYGEAIYDLKLDGEFLIAVGSDGTATGTDTPQWRIERRSAIDGALVDGFGNGGTLLLDVSRGIDVPFAVAVDAADIYIVGRDDSAGNAGWRLEARDKTTGGLDNSTEWGGILQLNPSPAEDVAQALWVDADGLYVGGDDSVAGNRGWRLLHWGRPAAPPPTAIPVDTPAPALACQRSCRVELGDGVGQLHVERFMKALFKDMRGCADRADTTCPCLTDRADRLRDTISGECAERLMCEANLLFAASLPGAWDSAGRCYADTGLNHCETNVLRAVARAAGQRFARLRSGKTERSLGTPAGA